MSYCTAQRQQLMSRMKELEDFLRQLRKEEKITNNDLDLLFQQLQDIQNELVAIGDCGD